MNIRSVISLACGMLGMVALLSFNLPLFMLAFVLAALASGTSKEPVMSMAVVRGMDFVRGRLGNIGFRQQVVRNGSSGYKRRTVAFQIPESVANPQTPGQVRQRTRFRLVQSLGSALARKSILYNFYQASGISGYNAFIRDNIAGAVVGTDGGDVYVDFRKLQVTKGDFAKGIKAYQSEVAPVDDCSQVKKLAWDYDWTCDPEGVYALNLIGIKINEEGAVDDIVCVQPRVPMQTCVADVQLPSCDCCKTYWYAYFVDPLSGYYSTASYIGTGTCEMPEWEDNCYICNLPQFAQTITLPPEECPIGCGDKEVDTGAILFNGDTLVENSAPLGGGVLFSACPLYTPAMILNEAGDTATISLASSEELANVLVLDAAGNELYSGSSLPISVPVDANTGSLTIAVTSNDDRCNASFDLPVAIEGGGGEAPTNTPPIIELSISDGDTLEQTTTFTANATDAEDRDDDLSGNLSVTSDIDGLLTANPDGTYGPLSEGIHTITATVTDSGGLTTTKVLKVTSA